MLYWPSRRLKSLHTLAEKLRALLAQEKDQKHIETYEREIAKCEALRCAARGSRQHAREMERRWTGGRPAAAAGGAPACATHAAIARRAKMRGRLLAWQPAPTG